jgi:hypothetical protein
MRKYRDEVSVQRASLNLLEILAYASSSARRSIGEFGGLRDVVTALRTALDCDEAVSSAFACMRYLAFASANRMKAGDCNCVPAILEAVSRRKASTDLVQKALLALANLTFDNEPNKEAVASSEGIREVIDLMHLHEGVPDLVAGACRVFRNVSDSILEIKSACQANGAVKAVCAAMTRHIGHTGIQEHGAAMLINMIELCLEEVHNTALYEHIDSICEMNALSTDAFAQVSYLRSQLLSAPDEPSDGTKFSSTKNRPRAISPTTRHRSQAAETLARGKTRPSLRRAHEPILSQSSSTPDRDRERHSPTDQRPEASSSADAHAYDY